jgi:hypothetical protein
MPTGIVNGLARHGGSLVSRLGAPPGGKRVALPVLWRSPRSLGFLVAAMTILGTLTVASMVGRLSHTTSVPATRLTDLRDTGQLRSLFNADAGETRLILILSPT